MIKEGDAKINIFFAGRLAIAVLFIVSGIEKLVSPYQNFLYVIQGYELLKNPIDAWVAIGMPWIELFVGVFLLLGLWTPMALKGAGLLFVSFIVVVGQALIRRLPIDECGCFGQLVSFPLPVVLTMDSVMLLITIALMKKIDKTSTFSLDQYFLK